MVSAVGGGLAEEEVGLVDLNELRYGLNYSCVNFLIWMLSYV